MRSLSQNVGRGRKGQSAIEIALMAPWIFLLFIGVLDLGFWSYQMICVENATRAVGLYAAKNGPVVTVDMRRLACGELDRVINMPLASCMADVNTLRITNLGDIPPSGAQSLRHRLSLEVPMTPMIPIPGLLQTSRLTRVVEVPSVL